MGKNLFISNSKKLPRAFFIALSVIIIMYFTEMFILPINFFTFRTWEALMVKEILPGSFYPNMKISMTEAGDLGRHTKFAVEKKVRWETDRYGYRKHDTGIDRYQIVILGDSAIAGTGLTQEDILSEVLERRLKLNVYPFTPSRYPLVASFLDTKRFADSPPDIVIFETIEKKIPELPKVVLNYNSRQKYSWLEQHWRSFLDRYPYFAILLDRIYKNNMGYYFKSRIEIMAQYPATFLIKANKREYNPPGTVQSIANDKMLFLKETVDKMAINKEIPPEEIERISEVIVSYAGIFKERGIRFIFLPIPNKENIYYEHLPIKNKTKPRFLGNLILKLQNKGIEVVDTQKAFDEALRQSDSLLYQTDDTHWNPNGVRITADLIEKLLRRSLTKF